VRLLDWFRVKDPDDYDDDGDDDVAPDADDVTGGTGSAAGTNGSSPASSNGSADGSRNGSSNGSSNGWHDGWHDDGLGGAWPAAVYPELPPELGDPPHGDLDQARAYLAHWAGEYAAARIPTEHTPDDRALPAELAVERHHAATQIRIKQWAPKGRDGLEGLRADRQARADGAEATADRIEREHDERRAELKQYDQAITGSDQERRYEVERPRFRRYLLAAPLVFALLEFPALFPAVSQALNLSSWLTVPATVATGLVQILLAEGTGMAIRHWQTSADPPAVRRLVGAGAIVGLTALAGFVAALVKARSSLDDADVNAWASVPLLLAMQVAFVLVSLLTGWYNHDAPEVAARRGIARDCDRLEDEHEDAVATREGLRAEVHHIEGLLEGWEPWVADLKVRTMTDYEAVLLTFRSDLGTRLQRAGDTPAAYRLDRLPKPPLAVPIDEGPLSASDDLHENPPDLDLS
jgi:hypothetical protein